MNPEMEKELLELLNRFSESVRAHERALLADENRFEISRRVYYIDDDINQIKQLVNEFIKGIN